MNVELLQCRYPPETMQQVAKLSEGLAKDYHRSRAYMLKRTFVSASDAAASKVRREDVLTTANNDNSNTDNGTEGPSGMIPRNVMDCIRKDVVIIDNNVSNTMVAFNKLSNGMQMKIFNQYNQDGVHEATVEIAGFTIGKARGDTSKVAQSTVSDIVLAFLSQHCYSLKRKMHVSQIEGIEVLSKAETSHGSAENNTTDSTKLSSDNLGFQLMTKLGWTGGSLGARGDGILDPVDMEQKFDRTGLGKDTLDGKMNAATIKQKLYELRNSTEQDRIVFSSEYTKQDRKLIHSLAQALNLRSLSYGKDYNRTRRLVVSRRLLGPREILRKILAEKDPLYCKMYEVVPPSAQE
uniref:G-patch domain-containing protein n=1 Tax=Anopheles dirus TaxID=7168 RepID=A0A182NGA5_9DIPT